MLEKILNKKDFRRIVYLVGALLEIIGFGLLFAFDKAIKIIQNYPILFSIIIIVSGYLLAVAVRKR